MNPEEGYSQLKQHSVVLSQKIQDIINAGLIKNSCILLYNQSTVYVFSEWRFLKDIHQIYSWMDIHCNFVVTSTNWVGYFPGVGRVWCHPNVITNILSLSKMSNQVRITYDSGGSNAFEVHKSDGAVRSFVESPCVLLYMDINNYHLGDALVTTVSYKNIITMLRNILVLNVPDISNIILVDLAWLNSSKN